MSLHWLNWTECPGRELALKGEVTEEHLTTSQAAEQLRVSTDRVVGLIARGKLSGRKIGVRWQIPVAVVREYIKTAPLRRRVSRS
jgi:excisionase family DNA binding protein